MNAMILMSCLVFIDLEECTEKLENLTHFDKPKEVVPKKRKRRNSQPSCKYGEYLQKTYVPLYVTRTNYVNKSKQRSKPLPLGYKFRLRSDESYADLCNDDSFLEKRKERNKKEKQKERICNYKFWEAPSTLRNTDPKMVAYVNKLRMLKKKARARYKEPYKNVQYLISGVSFTGGRPHYILANVSLLPTGYIPINGGIVVTRNGESVTCIIGFWKYPRDIEDKCDITCDCMTKWEGVVMDYLKESKCRCGHLYDFYHESQKSTEKYFYPPTRHGPFWVDAAKIYQMDPMEDFIRDTFRDALKSKEATPTVSAPTISASGLKESELLSAFMADLTDTPLLTPHLPESNLLNSLQEWVRKRVKGKITGKQHKRMLLKSQRRWLDLKHLDHRARAFRIPFTLKQLENMKWSHRKLVQKLFEILLEDFVDRNRRKQCEQTRLWWATMKYDAYPSKAFLDIFFTYMPGRMKDTHLINPYSSDLTPKCGAKTCPLDT
ncbi:uncharacterized protein LOC113498555 [Trichoplusia ni]|nr:uncharacterized protein LOC113498555 [Trichoplusia ni]